MNELYILGAGTYGEVIFELAETVGYRIAGFYDDDPTLIGTKVMGNKVIGPLSSLTKSDMIGKNFAVAMGNNKIRFRVMQNILNNEGLLPTLIHPKANICRSAKIGVGVYIHAGACIWTKAEIGDFTFISPNTVIAHHTKVGKACLISTLCAVGAGVNINNFVMFGFGTTVITGVKNIGKNVMSGGGTVIIKDVEDNAVIVGNPARKIRDN